MSPGIRSAGTITYTGRAATDLGYLLHKNPSRPQSFDLAFGTAHVFYPEASEERCTAALLLEINPVDLAREHRNAAAEPLFAYVNDRPYVASSFMSVALARVFVRGEPLYRVHECVFGVLALESEPVDPRL